MRKNNLSMIQFAGSLLVLVGAALKFFQFEFANYIFVLGAALLLGLQTFYVSKSGEETDLQAKRLIRLMFIASLFLGIAAYFMFTGKNTWVPLLLAYALISLYISFRSKNSNG